MKYLKTKHMMKAANVELCLITLKSYSYGWWLMSKRVGNKIVFNSYKYSKSTIRHQDRVISILAQMSGDIVRVECPQGLQDMNSGINYAQSKIDTLKLAMSNPRSKKAKNEEREWEIIKLEQDIETLKELIAKDV